MSLYVLEPKNTQIFCDNLKIVPQALVKWLLYDELYESSQYWISLDFPFLAYIIGVSKDCIAVSLLCLQCHGQPLKMSMNGLTCYLSRHFCMI